MNSTTFINKEEITKSEENLLKAIKASDINVLDELLHDDLLFITPDGQTITKVMDLDSHRSGTMIVDEISSNIELINFIEDTAIVVVVIETKGKMLGQPIEGKFRYLRVWKLFSDNWKVIGGSCTKL
jgi:ketosteroid isomerase-like protein